MDAFVTPQVSQMSKMTSYVHSSRRINRYLQDVVKIHKKYMEIRSREIKARQVLILKKYCKVLGNELLKAELEEMDNHIRQVCSVAMPVDSFLLGRRPTIIPSEAKETNSPTAESPEQPPNDVSEDVSKAPSKVPSRPSYPWENNEGMRWLRSLGSTLPASEKARFQPCLHRVKQENVLRSSTRRENQANFNHTDLSTHAMMRVREDDPQFSGESELLDYEIMRRNSENAKVHEDNGIGQAEVSEIQSLLDNYEAQHKSLFRRNFYSRLRRNKEAQYSPLHIEDYLRKRVQAVFVDGDGYSVAFRDPLKGKECQYDAGERGTRGTNFAKTYAKSKPQMTNLPPMTLK